MDKLHRIWIFWKQFPRFSSFILENNITGDVLIHADHELLKQLDINSVGRRLTLLKNIYHLKKAQNIPFDEGDYIPETALSNTSPGVVVLDVDTGWKLQESKRIWKYACWKGWTNQEITIGSPTASSNLGAIPWRD